MREANTALPTRFGRGGAAGQRGRHFPKVLQGNLGELQLAKANAVVGRGRSSGEAVGIRSRVHFSRCYMTPLVEKGLVARTDPDKPMSPRQEYKLA